MCQGLLAFHKRNILHRDIKSDNVFLAYNGDVKLADLGFSVFLSEQKSNRTTQCGTLNWLAPEIISGQQYSKSVDIWALGITAYEVAKFLPPFLEKDQSVVRLKIMTEPIPSISHRYSPHFQDFINQCLQHDVESRWDIQMLC